MGKKQCCYKSVKFDILYGTYCIKRDVMVGQQGKRVESIGISQVQ